MEPDKPKAVAYEDVLADLNDFQTLRVLLIHIDANRRLCHSIAEKWIHQQRLTTAQIEDCRSDVDAMKLQFGDMRKTHEQTCRLIDNSARIALADVERGKRVVGRFKGQSFTTCTLQISGDFTNLFERWILTDFGDFTSRWRSLPVKIDEFFDGIDWKSLFEDVTDEWRWAFPDRPPEINFKSFRPAHGTMDHIAGTPDYSPEIAELTRRVFAVRDTIGDTDAVPESYPKFQAAARELMQTVIPHPQPQNPVERWAVNLAGDVRALVVRYFGADVEQWSTEPLPARELWLFRNKLRRYIRNPDSSTEALENKVTEYRASLNGVWPETPANIEVPTTTADSDPPELEGTGDSDGLFPFSGAATRVATVEEDLQWFRGWATRINAMLDRPHFQPDRFDWIVFRPDRWAREAMIRFGGKWPVIIRQVQDFLDHAERKYATMCEQLPVEECLVCRDDEDYFDEQGYRSCRRCGARARLPDVDWPTVNTARSNAAGAYLRLAEVIETAVDAMEADSTREAVAAAPASDGNTALEPSIIVEVDRSRIIFQGETFDVGSPQALRWLKVLTDHPGVWISSADLTRHDSELDGARTSRLWKELPSAVAEHVKTKPGTGSRWNPPA